MLSIFAERLRQGFRTGAFPEKEPELPPLFRGRPLIHSDQCPADCDDCLSHCPYEAVRRQNGKFSVDLGRCLFCADCPACPHGCLSFGRDYRMAVNHRQDLFDDGKMIQLAQGLEKRMLKLFGRSLKLRQVSAGGCNACEADVNVLNTLVFDLSRFGIQFVASPRHADGILITGPVSRNMYTALLDTFEAIPDPKLVIASGACAIAGGPFAGSPEIHGGIEGILQVDLYIPGCPPHPYTTLDGLLRLLDKR